MGETLICCTNRDARPSLGPATRVSRAEANGPRGTMGPESRKPSFGLLGTPREGASSGRPMGNISVGAARELGPRQGARQAVVLA